MMDKYNQSAVTLKSFSYRKMDRRIRMAVISTQKTCEHRKDIPSSSLIYKQYRQPIWMLKLSSANTDDRHIWPRSRRVVNLLSDPYRKVYRTLFEDDHLFSLPISSQLRTRPKLSLRDRRPLRSWRDPPTCLRRLSPPRLVVPPAPIRRYQTFSQPLRSVTKDYSYLYDTRSGRTNESSDLGLKTRLLSRTSYYAFPILTGEVENPRKTTRLAERLYSTYANRTMEAETSKNFGLQSRLVTHNSGYKQVQFSTARESQISSRLTRSIGEICRKPTAYPRPVEIPTALKNKVGRWSKPFLPNKPLGPERTRINFRRKKFDETETTSYIGLPKTSLRIREPELVSNYTPRYCSSIDVSKTRVFQPVKNMNVPRRCTTRSEILPVSDDIALRLRLSLRLSPSAMARLYPNENLILSSLPTKPTKRHDKQTNFSDEFTTKSALSSARYISSYKATAIRSPKAPISSTQITYKPLPSHRRKISNDYLYPTAPPKNKQFGLRPLPGSNLRPQISRLRSNVLSTSEDEESSTEFTPHRILTSANNYSQLYVSHPENRPTTELGQRLKLSARSATSKVTSLYASYPVTPYLASLPKRRIKPVVTSTRIPEKYLPSAYVPRPGILSASRARPNLHGLAV